LPLSPPDGPRDIASPCARRRKSGKRIIYDTFGNIVDDSNKKIPLHLGFAGGLWDKETKLVHFGHRDYDPDVGRFITKDPIGYAGGDSLVWVLSGSTFPPSPLL
jgi:RHS repeat-associated protein